MIADLHNTIAALAPIHGISIGREADRSTWSIQFDDSATDAQRAAALAGLAAFDPLDGLKRDLEEAVQTAFDAACGAIVTPGAAMANVYRVQVDAAFRLIAGAISTHPALAALVGVLGPDEASVARIIYARNEECEAQIAALNRKRLVAKAAIEAATTEAGARAAANVAWGTP